MVAPVIAKLRSLYTEEEIKGIIGLKEDKGTFELINIVEKTKSSIDDGNTGILIASDFHIEETVKTSTVLGLNEFNIDIAEKRVKNYFANAIYMVKKHSINNLVVGLPGDFIGGYIHDEPAQTNSRTPMQGISTIKLNQTIKADKVFLGHFHQSIYTKEFCVNGSVKGYDAYACGMGLAYEEPKQAFVVLNKRRGSITYTNIFFLD